MEHINNVYNDIKMLIINMPEDLTEIEKARWLYIKLGELFSYDYRVAGDKSIGQKKIDFDSEYISNYQTCLQICEIMKRVYNELGIECNIITLEMEDKKYEIEHVANEIVLESGERYIADLTLDLPYIQSGSFTRNFMMSNKNNHDVISESRLMAIDEELKLIKNGEYTDKKIRDKKSVLNGLDYSNLTYDEMLVYKVGKIKEMIPNFNGYNEGKMFSEKLLNDFNIDHHLFNLIYKDDERNKVIGCFLVFGDENIWYIYAGNSGLIRTDAKKLSLMMERGWSCKSGMFHNMLEDEMNRMHK